MRIGARVVTQLFGFLLAVSALSLAQNATTSLRGTVYDAKGAVVAGATVTLTNPATAFSHTTKSDGQGNYQFLELPPAKYDLTVDAHGFAIVKQSGLELQVASPATLNLNLQVTGGTVTVEVSSSAPLVNTQDASLGHAFGEDQIADLPFEGRRPRWHSQFADGRGLHRKQHPYLQRVRQSSRLGEWSPQRPDQH